MEQLTGKIKRLSGLQKILNFLSAVFVLILCAVFILMLRGVLPVPQNIDLGFVKIHLYSLSLFSAFAVCLFLVSRLIKQMPAFQHVDLWEGLLYVFVPAIIGARIYHVLTDFYLYQNNLINIFAIWNGGLGFIGGALGGVLGLYFFAKWRKLPLDQVLGIVAVTVPLGQAVGRLGNFFNHELYGPPTGLPWGQFIPAAFRKPELGQYAFYHPLFLYEAAANLVLFSVLWRLWQRGIRGYMLVVIYAAGYGLIRFMLDFFRLDGRSGVYGLSYAQWLILIAYSAGGMLYLVIRNKKKSGT